MDTITISIDEFESLLTARIMLNLVCTMLESQGYEYDHVIADILQLRPKIVDKENIR